jgi:hypothetical protein
LFSSVSDEDRVADEFGRDGDAQGLDLLCVRKAGIDAAQSGEGADHEQGADEQDERECDLRDDEEVAGALAVVAGAGCSSGGGERGLGARVFESGNGAEEES